MHSENTTHLSYNLKYAERKQNFNLVKLIYIRSSHNQCCLAYIWDKVPKITQILIFFSYEEALIEASNGTLKGLPYIDWRLDYRLSYAPDSVLWTSNYLGTGNGQVTNGPFANWRIGGTTLVRNIGMMPYPTEESDVRNLYTIDSLRMFANELENVHNLGHIYIGGLMNDLSTATFDPTFFMHHCWVDYLWWRYQCPGGNCISGRFQYPGTEADGLHAPERNMDNLIYEGTLKNKDGYDQRWLQSVEYENSPADCRNNCNSRYNTAGLYCTSSRCISAGTTNSLSGKKRRKRSPRSVRRSRKSSRRVRRHKRNTLSYPVQNVFRVDCESNTDLWGFLPVKVVHVRSKKQVYNSFTVQNGTVQSSTSYDFYDNQPDIRKIDQYTRPGHPKHFKHCKTDPSGALRINVNSFGLNYQGNYDEYAIVDDRIPVSSAMTYVAVRRPTRRRSSMVYLTSFDSCGRYCTPECLVPRSNPPRYRPCTGAIQINRRYPRGYADTYDDAVLMYFKFQKPGGCPTPMEQNVPIVFFCKLEENWIPVP